MKTIVEYTQEVKDCIDANIEALANVRAELGAHNFFTTENTFNGDYGVWAVENNGVRITNTQSSTYSVVRFYQNLAPNTDYILTLNVTVTSGNSRVLIKGDNTVIELDENPSSNNTYTFNSGNYNELFVALYCTKATAGIGSVLYDNILLRLADDTSTEYQPYAMTNRELTENKVDWASNGVLGAHNLGKKYNGVTNIGITLKDAPDGGNYVNGTATSSGGRLNLKSDNFVLKAGTYSIVGESNDHSKYSSVILQKTSDNSVLGSYSISNGIVDKSQATVTLAADTECYFGFNTSNGAAYGTDTFIIYPMVKLADDKDDTFYPYAKTNRELTKVAEQVQGNYVFTGMNSVSVTADGVKNWGALFNELINSLDSYLSSHTDEYIKITGLLYASDFTLAPSDYDIYRMYHNSIDTRLRFSGVNLDTSSLVIRTINLSKTLASCQNYVSNNGTITDNTSSIATSGMVTSIYFESYKKIS